MLCVVCVYHHNNNGMVKENSYLQINDFLFKIEVALSECMSYTLGIIFPFGKNHILLNVAAVACYVAAHSMVLWRFLARLSLVWHSLHSSTPRAECMTLYGVVSYFFIVILDHVLSLVSSRLPFISSSAICIYFFFCVFAPWLHRNIARPNTRGWWVATSDVEPAAARGEYENHTHTHYSHVDFFV